jgi:putative transcriptional regulator
MGKGFESIRQGLTEAIGHVKGEQAEVQIWHPVAVDVAAVRGRIGLTQTQFAARFGVSVATLRHWERGDRSPHGPALVLLNLIDRDPAGVLRMLGSRFRTGQQQAARRTQTRRLDRPAIWVATRFC